MAKEYKCIAYDPNYTNAVGEVALEIGQLSLLCTRITRVDQFYRIFVEDGFGNDFLYREVHAHRVQYVSPDMPTKTIIAILSANREQEAEGLVVVTRDEDGSTTEHVVVDFAMEDYILRNPKTLNEYPSAKVKDVLLVIEKEPDNE